MITQLPQVFLPPFSDMVTQLPQVLLPPFPDAGDLVTQLNSPRFSSLRFLMPSSGEEESETDSEEEATSQAAKQVDALTKKHFETQEAAVVRNISTYSLYRDST
jgi:hypothetical protein